MLQLTRLSGPTFALNPDLIERVEATPDTVVTLVNGSKYVVRESLDELIDLVRAYRAELVRATATPEAAPTRRASHAGAAAATAATEATVVPLRADTGHHIAAQIAHIHPVHTEEA